MKNIIPYINKLMLAFVFAWGLSISESSATHIVAGNITYRHIAGDEYQIRLTLRRDCFLGSPDAQFDDPANVWIFTAAGAQATWLANNGSIKMPFMASDTLNEYIRSDCGFEGTQVCVHETTYIGNVKLPYRQGGYILAYQRCCRNGSILNIIDPIQTGATYWTQISEAALNLKNTSPVFKQWPDVYICANKDLVFDHGATDRDGDSLVYKLCIPNSGATLADPKPGTANPPPYGLVNFKAPFGLNNLFGGTPLNIDMKTGTLTGNPSTVGQFLIGICVEEYRKGVLIGTTRRDFQYNVRVCSQPPLAQFTTTESKCEGLTVEFFNNSLASSSYLWDFDYPNNNPAFLSTERNPVFTYPNAGVYNVRLRATRGTDGCFDTLLQKVSVFINKIIPNYKYNLSGCKVGSDSLNVNLNDASGFNEPGYVLESWKWTVTQNGITFITTGKLSEIKISKVGEVKVLLEIEASNGCINSKEFTIDPSTLIPKSDFSFATAGCTNAGVVNIQLNNLSAPLNPFAQITSSNWNLNGFAGTGDNTTIVLPQNTTEVTAILTTSFAGGACDISLEKKFSLQDLIPQANASLSTVECPSDDRVTLQLTYNNTNDLGVTANNLAWVTKSGGIVNGFNGNTINFTIPKDSLLDYRLIATFANGCLDTVSASLIPGPFAQISFVADTLILCPQQKKTFVLNPNANWTYTWSPTIGLDLTVPSNPIVSIDQNITYQVTVSDGKCAVQGNVDIIALSGGVVVAIEGDTVSCDGTIDLKAFGGVGTGVYSWGTEPNISTVIATGETISTTFTGDSKSFYVQFVGQSCSTAPAEIKVYNQKVKIEDASPLVICKGDTAKILTVNLVPSHQNTIVWNADTHIISGGNTYTPTIGIGANETSPFQLIYNVENQYGCSLTDTFKFQIGINPIIDFDITFQECGKTEYCFDIEGAYNGFLSWDFGDPTTNNDKSLLENPCYPYPSPGAYDVVINNLIDVCPFKPVKKSIVVNPPIFVNAGNDQVLCFGDTLRANATSNISNVNYTWTNSLGTIVSDTSFYQTVLNDNVLLFVKVVDLNGCIDIDTLGGTAFKFNYQVSIPDSLCVNENSKVSLNLLNPNEYIISWGPSDIVVGGANTTNPDIKGLNGIPLELLITHIATGCKDEKSYTPKITKPFDFTIDAPTVYCFNQPIDIELSILDPNNYSYIWSPADCFVGNATQQNPTIKISQDKNIKVLVTNRSSGCKEENTFLAKVGTEISVDIDAQPDFTIYEGKSIDIFVKDPVNGNSYLWTTTETTSSISVNPTETTTYSVTVTDRNGCTGTDVAVVEVRKAQCDESDIFLPNAFSPNNDGINDVLFVRSNFIDELELVIYNRWGQEVFTSNAQNDGWNGTFGGKELPPDAYAYYFKAKCINGETYSKKGNVTLIR